MKKIAPVILCLLLLTGCGHAIRPHPVIIPEHVTVPTEAETIPTEMITVPTEPETTLPLHSDYYDPDYSVDDMITWFSEVNFDAEFVNGGDPGLIQKWETPVYYYIFGEPTDEDLESLNDFEQWVNTVEGFPGMSRTTDLGLANMKIYFCTEQELLNIMGNDFSNLDGAVTYWYSDNIIYDATVCIRTDLSQHLRNSVIKEELYNGLGPINDTALREDSIIFSEFTEPQELTAVDEIIMELLYNPQIECGMGPEECDEVLRSLYY